MKNILAFVFVLLLFSTALSAQNLVPNPSFEENTGIPIYRGYLHLAVPWRNPNDRTPDYMHEDCDENGLDRPDIPLNLWGYQYARTGKAYIALHSWTFESQNIEFVQVDLKEALQAGKEYKVEAWISRAERTGQSTNCHGFFFSEALFYDSGFIDSIPQLNDISIIRDTLNWVKIGGEFVPKKNYKVMTIGNFCGENPPFEMLDETGSYIYSSTYYWDDISVELIERHADFDFSIVGICLPATVNLSTTPFAPGDDLIWTWSDGVVQNGEHVQRVFEQSGAFTVKLTITHNTAVYSVEKEIVIDMPLAPIADFEIEETKRGMKKDIHFQNLSDNATQWRWDFGDSTLTNEETPVHAFDTVGYFRILLTASNEVGCTDTASQEVYIACINRMVFNAITPNGDGQNEELPFDRLAICEGPLHIKIFNRWGNLVFESEDPSTPWRADNVPSGTYYFIVSYLGGREEGYIDVIK